MLWGIESGHITDYWDIGRGGRDERGHIRDGMGSNHHLYAGKRNLKICVVQAVAKTSHNNQQVRWTKHLPLVHELPQHSYSKWRLKAMRNEKKSIVGVV